MAKRTEDYLLAFTLATPPPYTFTLGEMSTEEFHGIREAFEETFGPRNAILSTPWAQVYRTVLNDGRCLFDCEAIGADLETRRERVISVTAVARGWLAAYRMMKDRHPE
jgi:hypothetical protein